MSVFAEALEEAQGVDLAFDNYREDIRLGHKKIFYSADICRKVVDDKGVEHSIPPGRRCREPVCASARQGKQPRPVQRVP